tara:strand:- start:90 stop:419 length:330 start_codon:yes stop_codon:yes gene_type:complete
MSLKGYEILFIVLPTFTEEKRQSIAEEITTNITDNNGEVVKLEELGLKDFAMTLKKQDKGYYYLCTFKTAPSKIKKLQEKLLISENIFRYQISTLDSILSKENYAKVMQ